MKRLEVIASYIPPYQTIADIGCDHGYLIKIAIDNYNIEKAFAVDNKEMPLQSAKNLLSNYPNVTFSLSYGISMLPDDIDVVVMSGMGGTLIKKIIEKDFEKLRNVKRIIVEANRDEQKVRTLLVNNHFKITNEVIMEEDGIIYEIIVFEKKDNVTNFKLNDDVFSIIFNKEYSIDDLMFGPFLRKEKSPLFIKKWKKRREEFMKNPKSISKLYIGMIDDMFNE